MTDLDQPRNSRPRGVASNRAGDTYWVIDASDTVFGSLYVLSLAASDPGVDTITSWTITWGDGVIETVAGNPPSVTHVYADGPNTYTISATGTDEDGTFASVGAWLLDAANDEAVFLEVGGIGSSR